ncbi:MAG: hypothetical protein H6836_04225 [Planctomycetes bacterium]|nr:hypothetical protein [Planctomycetota bacterium]
MPHRRRRCPTLSTLLFTGTLALPAAAQCDLAFQPGELVGTPYSLTVGVGKLQVWDPDGAGPLPDLLIAGGSFAVRSSQSVSIAGWDGTEWQLLGTPPAGGCSALTTFGGRLVAALERSSLATDIATFDGATWQVIGTVNGTVRAMALFNGNLVVGGAFGHVNGLPAASIAQWNGTAWSALGVSAGGVSGTVRALAVYSGVLYVGGDITAASGIPVGNLAVWTGSAWASSAVFNGTVEALGVRITTAATSSHLFVGGAFTTVGVIPALRIARFNSVNGWFAMGAGLPLGACSTLFVRATGLTGYELTAGVRGDPPHSFYRWTGSTSTWGVLGTGPSTDRGTNSTSLALFRGSYCGVIGSRVYGLDASGSWLSLCGTGIDGPVETVHPTANDVILGGRFTAISGVRMNGVARGTFGAWLPLGSGMQGGVVTALTTMPNGDVIAAGEFSTAGGVSANAIARWNGSAWSPLGSGIRNNSIPGRVYALTVLPNGDLVAGGSFSEAGGKAANNIARWDGAAWWPLRGGTDNSVGALTVLANGELIAGGVFEKVDGLAMRGVARWNGSAWQGFPAQPNGGVGTLAVLADGQLLVGGSYSHVGSTAMPYIARWNGVFWSAVPGFNFVPFGAVDSIVPLPNGQAIVHLNPANLSTNPQMARFDGQGCVRLPLSPNQYISSGARTAQGEVLYSGWFTAIGSVPCAFLARVVSPCPARAPTYGSGCVGSGGANNLRVRELPWVGSYFRAEATGMPANSLAIAVTGGTQTAIPIAALLPQGRPGCDLLATLDLLQPVTPRLGSAQTQLFVPLTASLVGAVVYHQVIAFELGTSSSVLAITSTNGLRLTVGVF